MLFLEQFRERHTTMSPVISTSRFETPTVVLQDTADFRTRAHASCHGYHSTGQMHQHSADSETLPGKKNPCCHAGVGMKRLYLFYCTCERVGADASPCPPTMDRPQLLRPPSKPAANSHDRSSRASAATAHVLLIEPPTVVQAPAPAAANRSAYLVWRDGLRSSLRSTRSCLWHSGLSCPNIAARAEQANARIATKGRLAPYKTKPRFAQSVPADRAYLHTAERKHKTQGHNAKVCGPASHYVRDRNCHATMSSAGHLAKRGGISGSIRFAAGGSFPFDAQPLSL